MSVVSPPLSRPLAAVALAAAALLLCAVPAFAHTELRASTPEEGATVDELSEVRLEFTGDLLEIGTELTLVDAEGSEHELAPSFPSVNVVAGSLDGSLPAGDTALQWRVVAEDGHPIDGVLSFTYAGEQAPESPESPTENDAEADAPAAETPGAAAAAAPPEPTASSEPGDGETELSDLPTWMAVLLALAAAGGALAVVLAARSRMR